MKVTSLCVRLLIHGLMFVGSRDQHCHCAETAGAAFLRVSPNKLQFFELDSLSFHCEGFNESTEWRVWRTFRGVETFCDHKLEASRTPCVIEDAYEADSGEYWCEAKETGRSDSVYISVTAGSVILESPALPVIEGDDVTLICRNKTPSSVPVADFYKDGILTDTGYEGNITIHNISKADEGLYKCEITGVGQSAVSRLTVRESYRYVTIPPSPHEEKHPSNHHYHNILVAWIPVALTLLGLLLLLVLCKQKVLVCKFSKVPVQIADSPETQTVSGSAAVCAQAVGYHSITAITACSAEPGVHSFTGTPQIDQCTYDENVYYSTID